MNPSLKGVVEALDQTRDQIIDWQRALVAIPALGPDNGGDGEAAKADLIETWLRDRGLEVERLDAPDDRVPTGIRPNLIARLPGKSERTLWVIGHTDVVPPGDREKWGGDPFDLRIKRDRLFGRGTLDNHQALCAALAVIRCVQDRGVTPRLNLGLLAVADEETGSQYGLDYVVAHRGDLFSPDDLIVIPDFWTRDGLSIEVAEKSLLWLKFIVEGKQCHGSMPHLGCNSLYCAARLIVALEELRRVYDAEDPLFSPPASTFEATKKEANVENVNTIPGRDVFYLDARVLPAYDLEDVLHTARLIAGDVAAQTGAQIEVEAVQKVVAPPPTPIDAPVVQALTRAIRALRDQEPHAIGIGGGTVAAFFRQRGFPVAVWGTGPDTAHMPDEFCRLSNLIDDAKVLAHVLLEENE
ncbi:MAG: M20 family metallo-hydrolase [Proteobacteria bacterium]|nr:M20 family metallo-hydrolase [Pseudomonadota bacterium]MBU1742093.1 M20 family metallo-hydrolase [Pseudomonadota bacterium]